jgi:signal transduction histidine kinase
MHTGMAQGLGEIADVRDAQREQFLAIVSHEMRTPLTSIISFSELIRGEAAGLSPEGRRYLEIIERNADRLLTLVSDLLMLTRIETGALPLDLSWVDITRLCADSATAATPGAGKQDIAIHLDARDGPAIMADQRRLLQVMDNLIGNAVKFSHPDGVVRVSARWSPRRGGDGGTWRIGVSDSGIGIPPGEAKQLFDRFTRGSNARAAGLPGTGLGLSIVKVITEMHGGRVRVNSVLGTGTTFTVFLPLGALPPGAAIPAPGAQAARLPGAAGLFTMPAQLTGDESDR